VLSGWGMELAHMQHGHGDGSWHDMEEVHADSAGGDPERGWLRGRIFRCTACADEIRVVDAKDVETATEPLTGPSGG
jgi:hypothetical protein